MSEVKSDVFSLAGCFDTVACACLSTAHYSEISLSVIYYGMKLPNWCDVVLCLHDGSYAMNKMPCTFS